jgi:FkbM family methyltransferase
MSSVCYTNDNNNTFKLNNHRFSNNFRNRTNHEVIFRKINTYLILNKIIKNNVIDLGCWIGDNSIPWAKNMPESIIYAIDPSEENRNYILDMCNLNEVTNVNVIQKAISDRNEIVSTNEDLHHCSFVYNNPNNNGRTKINAYSLDYLYSQNEIDNIGYIHLDVEGMEFRVIKGSNDIIDKFRPIITFEQHLEIDNYIELSTYLTNKQYIVFMINEVLPGCRPDCRNFIAFPNEIYTDQLIDSIHTSIGSTVLTRQIPT